MVKRITALLLILALIPAAALADLKLRDDTPAQKMLKTYITNVNAFLVEQGELEINTIFDQNRDVAELGITAAENAELPEDVTVTVYLYYDSINRLLLKVDDVTRFPAIAAAFLQGLSPHTLNAKDALKEPAARAKTARDNPANSFEDEVEELNGTVPRIYYAYRPNQYHDNVNWIEMTVVFPMEGYWDEDMGTVTVETETKAPSYDSDQDKEYEGYYSRDKYDHYETFATPTPEPDSAAAEYDNWD